MEIEIEGGLRVEINEKNKTASIIKSPKAAGIVLVPKFVNYNNSQYIITSISEYSFDMDYIEFLTFPEDSEVESFENLSLSRAHIKKLRIPPKLKYLKCAWAQYLDDLTEIEISPKNHLFTYFENKYLLGKSHAESDQFDELYLTRRDIEDVVVPLQVKTIKLLAFNFLEKLKTVLIPSNSEIEIEGFAFQSSSIEKLEVASKTVNFHRLCFMQCYHLSVLSFPNAKKITFHDNSINDVRFDVKIFVRCGGKLAGPGVRKRKSQIIYLKDKKEKNVIRKTECEVMTDDCQNDHVESLEKENVTLKSYVKYLQKQLSRYEESLSYEEFSKSIEEGKPPISNYEKEDNEEKECEDRGTIIGPEDEEFQEVVCKIGEGGTSEVFKVYDRRRKKVICKKVIKECDDAVAFKTLRNSVKEIEASQSIHHPCICELLGYNMQEELPLIKKDDHKVDSDEDEDDGSKEKVRKTTIALFFELFPFSVKDVIEKGLMSSTLKARIAVEVAFAMLHIHSLGMMHRDLKLENIMMNSVFESKVIDFGLVHLSDTSGSASLTKGVGTLAYMSPEMVNEEDYDNKTDVYSYGIVLFTLFTGKLPKQSMRDKMNNIPMKYPNASSKISDFCINLIKKCTSYTAASRPSFGEIIEDMFNNSFCLAPEVDVKAVTRRYRELNRFRQSINNIKK